MKRYLRPIYKQFVNSPFLVFLMSVFAAFLRFYNINWGAPFYFHPDERNIASSVSQLLFPTQMNPHFFAYGSLPIYTIFFTGLLSHVFSCQAFHIRCQLASLSFEEAIVISRMFSACFSILLIPLLYLLGKKMKNERTGLIAAFLALTSVGFIQFAHFGTFEMWLTIESVLLFYFCLNLWNDKKGIAFLFTGLIFGAAIATKVSHLVLLPLPILMLFLRQRFWDIRGHVVSDTDLDSTQSFQSSPQFLFVQKLFQKLFAFIRESVLFIAITILVYFLTNPYVILDTGSFWNSMHYESGVALGSLKVFYTGEFFDTIPGVFQFLHVYPFLLNPVLLGFFVFSLLYVIYVSLRMKKLSYIFLTLFWLLLFVSQAFLYVKWTRYMVPTLPFIYLMIGLFFSSSWMRRQIFTEVTFVIVVLFSVIFSMAYFVTAFDRPDTRIAAASWAQAAIPADAPILSEVYDLGITPFNSFFHTITLFNFYDLDNATPESSPQALQQQLSQIKYIILPSQRVLKMRMLNQKRFPNGYVFYSELLNGNLGFKEVYESPCDLLCKISYLGSPVYRYEETANVFDRPKVMIFEKK
jgi:hypothetical protein